jgi:hypothetical protein
MNFTHMLPTSPIYVKFDLDKNEGLIRFSPQHTIVKPLSKTSSDGSCVLMAYIEYPISVNGEKWEFCWKQFHKKEQFLYLEQYVPFPTSTYIFQPNKYTPRATLASWSYIAYPSKGTTQTNRIKHSINYCFSQKYSLTMEVTGGESVANWSTDD